MLGIRHTAVVAVLILCCVAVVVLSVGTILAQPFGNVRPLKTLHVPPTTTTTQTVREPTTMQSSQTLPATQCHWRIMSYSWLLSSTPAMCLRDSTDALSGVIHQVGRWPDCDELLEMLDTTSEGMFVDAGANIGACTTFIAGHKVPTHAFEPQPDNLLYLRATLENNAELSSWVTVHDVGLGDHAHSSVIYRQEGNAGNSVVGLVHPDDPGNLQDRQAMERNKAGVSVRLLDEELWPSHSAQDPAPKIALMKMDVQGYEVKVLKGARRLFDARCIQAIKTELAPAFLAAQGSTAADLCAILKDAGFDLFGKLRGPPMSVQECGGHTGELYASLPPAA